MLLEQRALFSVPHDMCRTFWASAHHVPDALYAQRTSRAQYKSKNRNNRLDSL
jgi:hypothetical protein